MTICHQFDYIKPKSKSELLSLLSKKKIFNILAGGTDLVNEIRESLKTPELLIDLKGIPGLNKIIFGGTNLKIGPLVTFTDLIESKIINKHFPLLAQMARKVASPAIRNRATLVGNISSAVPSIDSAPVLLVYQAKIVVCSKRLGSRKIPISNFFKGPRKTDLHRDEFVQEIIISKPKNEHSGDYQKLGRYLGEDLAQASVATLAFANLNYRVAFGAVGPIPIRALEVEKVLNGKRINQESISNALKQAVKEITPITDIRANKEYRTHMIAVMLERSLATTCRAVQ